MSKTAVTILYSHPDIGDVGLSELYPIKEVGTHAQKHEVPRIIYRTLLPSRLSDGEIFTYNVVDISDKTIDDAKAWFKDAEFTESSLNYIVVGNYKTLKTPLESVLKGKGFEPCVDINKVLDAKFSAQSNHKDGDFLVSYIKNETKTSVVFCSVEGEYCNNVIASLSRYTIPWYFEEKPYSDEERDLLKQIEVGEEEFVAKAQALYDKTDIPNQVSKIKFKNMYKSVKDNLIRRHEENINQWNSDFNRLQGQISDIIKKIQEASTIKIALENSKTDDGHELAEVFNSRQTIAIRNWEGNKLIFTAMAYISAFSDADNCVKNTNHKLYAYRPGDVSKEDAKMLMSSVFIDREIRIPVYANFEFSVENAEINVRKGFSPASKFAYCVPQPHHEYYSCMQTNATAANEYMKEGKYAQAIGQILGSVSTLNLGDSAVVGAFSEKTLWNKEVKAYMLPDKTMVNYEDAIKWLKENAEEVEE